MSRTPNPTPAPAADRLNMGELQAASNALTVLGTRSAEVADHFDDGQVYDRTRVVSEARFFLTQSADAMLEAGKRLILIKENEPHGEFIEIVTERLGMERRHAQLMMQAAVKYLSPALASKAKSISLLGKTKLLALMFEPDEDIAALAEGGTVAGLQLDDMQAMSSRELKAALVDARKKAAAKDQVIAKKDDKLNELAEVEAQRRSASKNERQDQQLTELRDATLAVEQALEVLVSLLDAVTNQPATEAAGLAARQTLDYVAQRLVDSAEQRGLALNLADQVMPLQLKAMRDAVKASRN